MVASLFDGGFRESTRGRVVELLRRGQHTVEELAAALGLTDNAVRLHLTALERDGIVQTAGVRRLAGAGKPATIYEISRAAEPAFSRAYLPFLTTLLDVLRDRLPNAALRGIMRDVGRRLAGTERGTDRSLAGRVDLAARVLNDLGGITAVKRQRDGTLTLEGCGCPLAAAVVQRRDVCLAVETMLSEIIGADVTEQCDRSDRPQCRFRVAG